MSVQPSSAASQPSAADRSVAERHWKRNLAVCVLGAFTTIIAMTLLLPFLPLYVENLGVSDPAAIVQWSGWHSVRPFCPQPSQHRSGGGWATAMAAS